MPRRRSAKTFAGILTLRAARSATVHRTGLIMLGRIISLEKAADLDASLIGGKASHLAHLVHSGLPVPAAQVLTVEAFVDFMQASGVIDLIDALSQETDEEKIRDASARIKRDIHAYPLSAQLAASLSEAFLELREGDAHEIVARSSATLEDSASASFAGMFSSIPGVTTAEGLYSAVKSCWASAFNPRALLYMKQKELDVRAVLVAVVLQRQIASERSGLAFGRDPARREADVVIVEAIQGYGEDLVSGEITPERYEFTPSTRRVVRVNPPTLPVGAEPKLTDREVALLADWTRMAEDLFGTAQDIEWAFADGDFFLLQSRPLLFSDTEEMLFPQIGEHTVALRGIGVSPAVGSGTVMLFTGEGTRIMPPGTVVVVPRLTNDLAVHLREASAVIADEGGATSHGANILREFGIACVLSTGDATRTLADGDVVTVDGFRGVVYRGDLAIRPPDAAETTDTRMKIFVSVLIPEQAAPLATYADGVSSLRNDYFLLQSGVHPAKMIHDGRGWELEAALATGMMDTCHLFAGKPVWYKTLDAPTDEFRRLEGGEDEPSERNPLLGWRGLGRSLAEPRLFDVELRAVRRALESGAENIAIKLPFVRFAHEYEAALARMRSLGIVPHDEVAVGVSVETPATAMSLQDLVDIGVDFVSVGVSDLVMCVLAVDRESERVAELFRPAHPAVVEILARISDVTRPAGVFTCVCGESARDEELLPRLVDLEYDAIGVSLPYFTATKKQISAAEGGVCG